MKTEKLITARPKFLGYSLSLLVVPLDIIALMVAASFGLKGFSIIALLCIPATYYTIKCFSTKSQDAAGLIKIHEARIIYAICFAGSLIVWFSYNFTYALPGLLAAFLFSMHEQVVRKAVRRVFF